MRMDRFPLSAPSITSPVLGGTGLNDRGLRSFHRGPPGLGQADGLRQSIKVMNGKNSHRVANRYDVNGKETVRTVGRTIELVARKAPEATGKDLIETLLLDDDQRTVFGKDMMEHCKKH